MERLQNADRVGLFADRLRSAELARRPVAPLTDLAPDLSLHDAYRIQKVNIDRRVRAGDPVVGHKIGLTAKAMQALFGVDEPDYGHILKSMVRDRAALLDLSELIDPQIEVEPAFVLKQDLEGPDVGVDEVLAATDYITVCFEIIDSRIEEWRIRLQDTVADNGSSAMVVLGDRRLAPGDLPLDNLETTLEVDGKIVETGNTKAILGHPANGIAWLVNAISEFGVALSAGDVVLPGTCTRSYRIGGCKTATGRIEGLGEVTLNMTGASTVVRERNPNELTWEKDE